MIPPLDATFLTQSLVRPGGLWREVRVTGETVSTNADVLAAAAQGVPEGLVLAAEAQTAGRGRFGRPWVSPPGAGLTFSVLLRPGVPASRLSWLPLLAGVAAAQALTATVGVAARLKWPNDVLAGQRKLAGVLAESDGDAVVLGIGINVRQRAGELPPGATSLSLAAQYPDAQNPEAEHPDAGYPAQSRPAPARAALPGPDRSAVLVAVLRALEHWYLAWRDQPTPGDAQPCGLAAEYVARCATLGREVTVTLPGARVLAGTATGIDVTGRLEVTTEDGCVPVSAGDVVHVR